MAGNGWNGWKCPERLKWLEMSGNGWDGWEMLDIAENSLKDWKWLVSVGNAQNG